MGPGLVVREGRRPANPLPPKQLPAPPPTGAGPTSESRGWPVPHHKSAKKRVKTNEIRRQRNIARRTRMRNAIRDLRQALDSGQLSGEAASERVRKVHGLLDRMAGKGLIHENKAARLKSRLIGRVQG